MLAQNQGDRPLLKQLQHGFDNDVVLEFYAEPLVASLTKETGKSIDELWPWGCPTRRLVPIAKDVKAVSVRLNFSGKELLQSEVTTGKPETAAALALMAKQGAEAGKKKFEDVKKNPPPGPGAMFVPMISKVGDEVFDGLEVKGEDTQLTVNLPMPDSLADTLKTLSQVLGAFIPPPAPAGVILPRPRDSSHCAGSLEKAV